MDPLFPRPEPSETRYDADGVPQPVACAYIFDDEIHGTRGLDTHVRVLPRVHEAFRAWAAARGYECIETSVAEDTLRHVNVRVVRGGGPARGVALLATVSVLDERNGYARRERIELPSHGEREEDDGPILRAGGGGGGADWVALHLEETDDIMVVDRERLAGLVRACMAAEGEAATVSPSGETTPTKTNSSFSKTASVPWGSVEALGSVDD
jgi:hypothetical protein